MSTAQKIKYDLELNGFHVSKNYLNNEQLNLLRQLATFALPSKIAGVYYSLIDLNKEDSKRLSLEALNAARPSFEVFNEVFKILFPSFLVKAKKTLNSLDLHQDWTYTNEEEFVSGVLWIPLVDVSERNGCLQLIPRSHKLIENRRSYSFETSRYSVSAELESYITTLNCSAGDLVVFNPKLWHGSHQNQTDIDRIIFTAMLLETNAPFLYNQKLNDRYSRVYQLPEDTYFGGLKGLSSGQLPSGAKMIADERYTHQTLPKTEFINLLNRQFNA